jgi:small subunit ribosomal protein S5
VLESSPFIEKLIELKRVSKVVKGGKRLKLYACVVVGDGTGNVGIGHAKSSEVAPAIRKATESAKKTMMKPALIGTGIIASSAVRAVCEAAGIKNILTKSLGSHNPTNLARATINGLKSIRSVAEVAEMRNKPVEYFMRKKHEKTENNIEEESDRQTEET